MGGEGVVLAGDGAGQKKKKKRCGMYESLFKLTRKNSGIYVWFLLIKS